MPRSGGSLAGAGSGARGGMGGMESEPPQVAERNRHLKGKTNRPWRSFYRCQPPL